jgi:HAAS domain-containing protein
MTKQDSVESRVESYLDRVRTALHGLPERQIDDIMRELRAHAIELAEGRELRWRSHRSAIRWIWRKHTGLRARSFERNAAAHR